MTVNRLLHDTLAFQNTARTLETQERIKLQSPLDTTAPEPAIIRTGHGDNLSISQAARQVVNQRKVTETIVWGAEAIAPYLGRTTKGAFGALESGKVPGARKIAGRWALNLKVYFASFEGSKS